MKWEKILVPDQEDWEIQYDVVAYYGSQKVGTLVYSTEYGWQSVINGTVECLYDVKTEGDAKKKFKERLENFFDSEINYYEELRNMLDELN